MNFKRRLLLLFLTLVILPINALALDRKVVLGGENIGITIQSNGILIVGFYNDNAKKALKIGDLIVSINSKEVNSINDMLKLINPDSTKMILEIGYKRNQQLYKTTLELNRDANGVFKTGLYVKDSITGIGTLTFIDPETNKYGALGHSITDSQTNIKFEIKDGKIFKSDVVSIDKSSDGNPGEKNAKFYFDTVYGTIEKNLETGIYGTYNEKYNTNNLIEVANFDEIKVGKAYIRTTLVNNEIANFDIEILSVDTKNDTKNILFKITNQELLNKTGGIVRGMSGSPIIQNNKIIGAVTHTVISDNTKGYGISITKMLESIE